jgi:GT2 family glycosyltransferase
MKKTVSIVIVNYNGKELLKTILESLKKSSFKNYETIVLDNASTDGSQDFIRKRYKNVKLVANKKNLGYCGINTALKHCNGKYIFFTNNDVCLDKNCIKKLVQILDRDGNVGIASPKVINYFNKSLKSCGTWVSRAFYNGHFRCKDDFMKEIPYNGVAMIRKSIVDKFGYLFDKDYFIYTEDLDLGLRTRLLGYKVMHVPEAIIYHMHGLTARKQKNYTQTYRMERNLLTTFIKILSAKNIVLYLPYVIIMRFAGMIKDIATFNFVAVGARLFALFNVIIKLPVILRKRRSVQRMRKKDDSFLLSIFSEKYLFSNKKINV